jgi:hypothetical protein
VGLKKPNNVLLSGDKSLRECLIPPTKHKSNIQSTEKIFEQPLQQQNPTASVENWLRWEYRKMKHQDEKDHKSRKIINTASFLLTTAPPAKSSKPIYW